MGISPNTSKAERGKISRAFRAKVKAASKLELDVPWEHYQRIKTKRGSNKAEEAITSMYMI